MRNSNGAEISVFIKFHKISKLKKKILNSKIKKIKNFKVQNFKIFTKFQNFIRLLSEKNQTLMNDWGNSITMSMRQYSNL